MNYHLTKIYSQCLRRLHTDKNLNKNHYEALGLPSKATQADIKSAYYKLSMVYHPDKSSNQEDSQKFRDITEAYEVLGNVKLRRLYDKGLFKGASSTYTQPTNNFYKSREYRSRPPPPSGKTPIYDFDEWSRQHYGKTFVRDMERKQFRKAQKEKETERINDAKNDKVLFGVASLLVLLMFLFSQKPDYDKVNPTILNVLPISRQKSKEE